MISRELLECQCQVIGKSVFEDQKASPEVKQAVVEVVTSIVLDIRRIAEALDSIAAAMKKK